MGKTPKDRTLHFEFASLPTLEENTQAAEDWGDALGVCLGAAKVIQKAMHEGRPLAAPRPSTPNTYATTSNPVTPTVSPMPTSHRITVRSE